MDDNLALYRKHNGCKESKGTLVAACDRRDIFVGGFGLPMYGGRKRICGHDQRNAAGHWTLDSCLYHKAGRIWRRYCADLPRTVAWRREKPPAYRPELIFRLCFFHDTVGLSKGWT